MGKGKLMGGGFAYLNSSKGRIENCYAAVRMNPRGGENAGFVYDNRGTVFHCFTRSSTRAWKHSRNEKKQKDGFSIFNRGTIQNSFFLAKKEENLRDYRDASLGVAVKDAKPESLAQRFAWDSDVFEKENAQSMDFFPRNWHFALPENENVVIIRTERDLIDLIDRVNRGDGEAACGCYELDRDLDFHGKQLAPIGYDSRHPFEGAFNGKGHTICGFVLNGKDRQELGLFGYLKGTVANLRVDGIVKGKNCRTTAAFCAVNQGQIHCCEAVIEVHARYNLGMFVGENDGLIERCSVSGKSHGIFFPLLPLSPLLPVILLAAVIGLNPPEPPQDYYPVTEDSSIVPNAPIDEPQIRTNQNKASFQVPKTIEVDAATLTATSDSYIIKNPARGANYDFVAVLYLTNSRGEKVEVYRSGRVPVGYSISTLTLTPPGGTVLADGDYNALLVFTFYNQDTGEKGMIDSSVPLTIRIH